MAFPVGADKELSDEQVGDPIYPASHNIGRSKGHTNAVKKRLPKAECHRAEKKGVAPSHPFSMGAFII